MIRIAELDVEFDADAGAVRDLLDRINDADKFEVYKQGRTSRYVIAFDDEPPDIEELPVGGLGGDDDE